MTYENAKVLYKNFVDKGMKTEAENILIRYPEFKKKNGSNNRTRRKKR